MSLEYANIFDPLSEVGGVPDCGLPGATFCTPGCCVGLNPDTISLTAAMFPFWSAAVNSASTVH